MRNKNHSYQRLKRINTIFYLKQIKNTICNTTKKCKRLLFNVNINFFFKGIFSSSGIIKPIRMIYYTFFVIGLFSVSFEFLLPNESQVWAILSPIPEILALNIFYFSNLLFNFSHILMIFKSVFLFDQLIP